MNKTEIKLLRKADPKGPVPSFVKASGLSRQIAVIQYTYRADSVDMYFDEALWLRLLEFALKFGLDQQVSIVVEERTVARGLLWRAARVNTRFKEVEPETFLSEWNASNDPDRDPPPCIAVRQGRSLVLCIATEYWTQVGGPQPYADSYTYSIFAKNDVSGDVEGFLRAAESVQGWELSTIELR